MPATTGFQLVEGDLTIVQHVHELRLATIDHLAELAGRSYTRIHKRIAKLHEHGYLACITRRPLKHVYTIGAAGVLLLIEHGYAQKDLALKRLRHTERKELTIPHSLLVTDIHVRLLKLTRAQSFELSKWVEGSSLWDKVTTSNNENIPIQPDALFTIEDEKRRYHCFLEADVGTMAHSRMRLKVTGYAAWFHQQKHVKKFEGMKLFRVATITKTRRRAKELTTEFRAMMPAQWLAAYPVLALEDLTLEALIPELAHDAKA